MDARISKLWRDLTQRKARVAITILGLAVGLWGLGTTLVAQRILGVDLAENFTRTTPPHLVVPMRGLTPELRASIENLEHVVTTENRPMLQARLEIAPDRYLPLPLFVVDDFETMDVARIFPDRGAWPPEPGEVLIERDGRALIRFMGGDTPSTESAAARHGQPRARPATSGDELLIRLPNGVDVAARLAGTVFDPGQAPSRMEMMVYGYVDRATAMGWMPEGFSDRLLVRASGDLEDREAREALRSSVARLIDEAGAEAWNYVMPAPDEHPHQFQMNTILTLLLGLSLLGFVLSAVLIANLVAAILTNQIREIGTLKAIGASTRQVMGMYLAGMGALGLVSALIVLPLAIRAGYGLAGGMAMMLNFEVLTTSLPGSYYVLLTVAGALFPVLAALPAVRRWSRVPVRAALDNYGVAEPAGGDTAGARLTGWMPLTVRVGVRNALRAPRRTILSVLTLAVGALVFLFAMNLRASLLRTADVEDERWRHDLSVRFDEKVTLDRIAWIERFPWAAPVELWDSTGVEMARAPLHGSPRFGLSAVPADTVAFNPNLTTGAWPEPGDERGVVASHRFTSQYPSLRVGDEFDAVVDGREVTFVLRGVIKLFGPASLFMDAAGYQVLTGAPAGQGRTAFVSSKVDADIGLRQMQTLLESHFDMVGIGVSGVMMSQLATRVIRNHLLVIEVMLGIVAFLMLLVSSLGLATGISTGVVERTRELGVLRAIGGGPGAIHRIVAAEAIFVALVAWFAAALVSAPVSRWLNEWFGAGVVEYPFDYATSWGGLGLSLIVVLSLSLLATIGPVRAVNRRPVREAVCYE